jgi:hypothetical protein
MIDDGFPYVSHVYCLMVLCYVYFVVLFCLLLRVAAHRDMTASSFRASQHRHPLFMQAVRKEVRTMAFCSSLLLLLFTVVPACRLISCVAKSQHPLCGVNFTFKSNKIFIIKGTKQKREREHAMQRHGQRRFRMPLFSGKKWERALAFVGPGPLLTLTVTVDTVAPSNHHRSFRKETEPAFCAAQ